MFRNFILGGLALVAVLAFFPDTAHLSEAPVAHESLDHEHNQEDQDAEQSANNHCHSGVSCTGALDGRSFAVPSRAVFLSFQTKINVQVNGSSSFLENEPPVPIYRA